MIQGQTMRLKYYLIEAILPQGLDLQYVWYLGRGILPYHQGMTGESFKCGSTRHPSHVSARNAVDPKGVFWQTRTSGIKYSFLFIY